VPVITVNKVADEKRIIGKKVAEKEAKNLGSQPPKRYSCKFRYDDYKKNTRAEPTYFLSDPGARGQPYDRFISSYLDTAQLSTR
jgi:hypothetical protein